MRTGDIGDLDMDMGCWSACRGDFRWRRYQGPGVALPCMLNITTNLQQTTKCLTREYTKKPEHVNAMPLKVIGSVTLKL